ncbi:MAG: FecR domain-containing protein [Candidatus Amulumruptor sp.]|nr:FecR domain-containing protein [Candidatus Amulumruptor sp.]
MHHLLKNFKKGRLTPTDLAALRYEADQMDDDELLNAFEAAGIAGIDENDVDQAQLDMLTGQIAAKIRKRRITRILRIVSLSAAACLALLLVGTGTWYVMETTREYSRYAATLAIPNVITTGKSESVTVMLPDSSRVTLEPSSTLSYTLGDFNSEARVVNISGGAEFDVAHRDGAMFRVCGRQFDVTVTGTVFSVLSPESGDSAIVYLKEGAVAMHSDISDKSVRLSPNQMVYMSYSTGDFTIHDMTSSNDAKAIMRGDLIFTATPLKEVLSRIGETYDMTVTADNPRLDRRLFTGYLPSTNLPEAIVIIRQAFNLHTSLNDSTLTFSAK